MRSGHEETGWALKVSLKGLISTLFVCLFYLGLLFVTPGTCAGLLVGRAAEHLALLKGLGHLQGAVSPFLLFMF